MDCPTCNAVMAALGYCDGGTIYHCERCGTIKHGNQFVDAPPRVYVPKLVERCRQLAAKPALTEVARYWHSLGIAESIHLPADRRPAP